MHVPLFEYFSSLRARLRPLLHVASRASELVLGFPSWRRHSPVGGYKKHAGCVVLTVVICAPRLLSTRLSWRLPSPHILISTT